MIRTNITEVHMTTQEASDLADLMEDNGRTSIAAALDCAVANVAHKVGSSARIELIVDDS